MKISLPRIFSLILTRVSPSGKELTTASPRGMPTDWQIFWANAGCADPEKIFISRLNGVMAWVRGIVIVPPKTVFARGPRPGAVLKGGADLKLGPGNPLRRSKSRYRKATTNRSGGGWLSRSLEIENGLVHWTGRSENAAKPRIKIASRLFLAAASPQVARGERIGYRILKEWPVICSRFVTRTTR
jgi:hypothetical protein